MVFLQRLKGESEALVDFVAEGFLSRDGDETDIAGGINPINGLSLLPTSEVVRILYGCYQ